MEKIIATLELKIENSTHQFMNIADYLVARLKQEAPHVSATNENITRAETGFIAGFNYKKRNLWAIRNFHLQNRGEKPLDEIEANIKHHQTIYQTTYTWGRQIATETSGLPLEQLPIKTVKLAS